MHYLLIKMCCLIGFLYVLDVTAGEQWAAYRAKKIAKKLNKPILNVGSGTHSSSFTGPKYRGHVNCDLAAPFDAPCGHRKVCHCNAEDLSKFYNKEFGVALAANVLQYVPNKERALCELSRVADIVITTDNWIPWPQLGPGPTIRRKIFNLNHHL